MQLSSLIVAAVLALGARAHVVSIDKANPIPKVVALLTDLEAKIEADGKDEQQSYDKFACWCEETLAGKAKDIVDAKESIEALTTLIIKLKGEMAVHTVEIKQLKKDIAANLESQREATEVREKENEEYIEEKTESEQCIGALEAAINVLHGAGGGSLLSTMQQAQLLNVVDGVEGVLRRPAVTRSLKPEDLQAVQNFVAKPEDFIGGSNGGFLSAVQIAHNPFGDYAPQSTQIQGILKGMYDTFATGLEKSNAEEAQKQKGFEELMVLKRAELATNKETLRRTTVSEAEATKLHATSKQSLRDTKEQLEADEIFFDKAKSSCQAKAMAWAARTGLRTEELHGIARAVAILSDSNAKAVFVNATKAAPTFLQLSDKVIAPAAALSAYKGLQAIATKTGSLSLARIAAQVKSGGHFNAVIAAIQNMIILLREEEQSDVKERDFCTKKQMKNTQNIEDLDHDIKKDGEAVIRHQDDVKDLNIMALAIETEINATKKDIDSMKTMRSDEDVAMMQSVRDDLDAIDLIQQAMDALSGFYAKGGFIQKVEVTSAAPTYAPMPDTNFQSGTEYSGRSQEGTGIIAILGMIKEDLENEVKTARKQNGASGMMYEADLESLENSHSALEKRLTETEGQIADLDYKITDTEEHKMQKGTDLAGEKATEAALTKSCAWVKTHFTTRRDNRRKEVDGLIDAQNYLEGIDGF